MVLVTSLVEIDLDHDLAEVQAVVVVSGTRLGASRMQKRISLEMSSLFSRTLSFYVGVKI